MIQFKKIASFFKKNLKLEFPISVQRIKLKNLQGYCNFINNKFFIKISKTLNEGHSIDVLLHELAHAASWKQDKTYHGKNWAIKYGEIYQLYLKKFHNDDDTINF